MVAAASLPEPIAMSTSNFFFFKRLVSLLYSFSNIDAFCLGAPPHIIAHAQKHDLSFHMGVDNVCIVVSNNEFFRADVIHVKQLPDINNELSSYMPRPLLFEPPHPRPFSLLWHK